MPPEKDSLHGSPGPLTTKQLFERLDQMEKNQRIERHDANGKIGAAILKQGEEQIRTGDRIEKLESTVYNISVDVKEMRESMSPFAELAQSLKFRLLGDPNMQTIGLVKDYEQLKGTIESRLAGIEKVAKDNGETSSRVFKEQRWAIWGVVGTFLTTMGAIVIAWIQLKHP